MIIKVVCRGLLKGRRKVGRADKVGLDDPYRVGRPFISTVLDPAVLVASPSRLIGILGGSSAIACLQALWWALQSKCQPMRAIRSNRHWINVWDVSKLCLLTCHKDW